jgi:hypothetical protein
LKTTDTPRPTRPGRNPISEQPLDDGRPLSSGRPLYNEAVPEDLEADRIAVLEERVAELEAERDALQNELDSIVNRAADRWLSAVQFESKALAAIQQTVSWKVTKPLRAVRTLQSARNSARRKG